MYHRDSARPGKQHCPKVNINSTNSFMFAIVSFIYRMISIRQILQGSHGSTAGSTALTSPRLSMTARMFEQSLEHAKIKILREHLE